MPLDLGIANTLVGIDEYPSRLMIEMKAKLRSGRSMLDSFLCNILESVWQPPHVHSRH